MEMELENLIFSRRGGGEVGGRDMTDGMGLWLCRSSEDSMFELLCQLLSPVLKFISRCSKRLIE